MGNCIHKSEEIDEITSNKSSANVAILQELGVNVTDGKFKELFKNDADINEKRCERILFVLNVYNKWIEAQQNEKGDERLKLVNMYDIIHETMSEQYDIDDFLSDYRQITSVDRTAFGYDDEEKKEDKENENDFECDINECFLTQRNNRNKSKKSKYNNKRNEIFFIDSNANNNDGHEYDASDTRKKVVIQQILDVLHYFVFHTLRINTDKYIKRRNESQSDEEDEAEINGDDIFCIDAGIERFGALINKIKASSKRFSQDLNGENNNNKFKTSNNNKTSQTKSSLFLDDLYCEIKRRATNIEAMNELLSFLENDEYETDSIYQDIYEYHQSNILVFAADENGANKIFKSAVFEIDQQAMLYSAGVRYFYWDYYKINGNREWNVLWTAGNGQPTVEGNAGYLIIDWFVEKKYMNLKEEALNNKASTFSIFQYEDTFEKAQIKLNHWLKAEDATPLLAQHKWSKKQAWTEKVYGIKQNELIKIEHIMSLMMYCNFTVHSAAFSGTYRKKTVYETDLEMKERHREVYHWARSLRECVECYGEMMVESDIWMFYHGVSSTMLFDSTTIRLCGPLSTTTDFTIAWSIFGAEGIVLDLKNDNGATVFMDANFWTSFANEDERLFIGGLQVLQFDTIRNIPSKQNFKRLIKVINILDSMFDGYPLEGIKPNKGDVNTLLRLINGEIADIYLEKPYKSDIPQYISQLFHQFINQKNDININYAYVDKHFIYHSHVRECDFYGFGKFKQIFVSSSKTETMKISLFVELCPKLVSFTIFNAERREYEPSIHLNEDFVFEIMRCIDLLNKERNITFTELKIVNPIDSIQDFMHQNKQKFAEKGWALQTITYSHPGRPGTNTVSIHRFK